MDEIMRTSGLTKILETQHRCRQCKHSHSQRIYLRFCRTKRRGEKHHNEDDPESRPPGFGRSPAFWKKGDGPQLRNIQKNRIAYRESLFLRKK